MKLWVWLVMLTLIVLAALALSELTGTAQAHDAIPTAAQPLGWKYPWTCCSDLDCRDVSDSEIEESPDGYVIKATGELIPYADKRIKDSPDGVFHWCAHRAGINAGKTICLFVPPRGF